MLRLLSASSCFLLNIHAPPCSLVPKTHDIKCCSTTSSGEGMTINGAHFRRGISLTRPRLSFLWTKRKQISTPGCCFGPFNVFVRTPDARVFLITGIWCRICSRTGGFVTNQTSTSVHVVDNQNIVFPYACTLFLIVQLRSYSVLRL